MTSSLDHWSTGWLGLTTQLFLAGGSGGDMVVERDGAQTRYQLRQMLILWLRCCYCCLFFFFLLLIFILVPMVSLLGLCASLPVSLSPVCLKGWLCL